MNTSLTLWVLGGDLRQVHLARALAQEGVQVYTYAFDPPLHPLPLSRLTEADGVIFPMPVTSDGMTLFAPLSSGPSTALEELFSLCRPEQFLCGGRVDNALSALAAQHQLTLRDYYTREELILANCVPTAEGAIQLAMEHLPITIHDACVLVIGGGRLGKITAQRFAALGAKVTLAARRYDQLSWAHCFGYQTVHSECLSGQLAPYDLIINTAPAPLLGEAELGSTRPDCLLIDLASKPGGINRLAARQLDRKLLHALSLPGQVAPKTAGTILKETICHMLHEHPLRGRLS